MKITEKTSALHMHGVKLIKLCMGVLIAFFFAACAASSSSDGGITANSSGGNGGSSGNGGNSFKPPEACLEGGAEYENCFITKWDTTKPGESSNASGSNQIRLPLVTIGNADYAFLVYWGDGEFNSITAGNAPARTHTYDEPGVYTVYIIGTIRGWQFGGANININSFRGDAAKLLEVSQWGNLNLGDTYGRQFRGAANLNIIATDAPALTTTTNLDRAFAYATGFDGDLTNWDVSNVENFSSMFWNASSFNGDISGWKVGKSTNFSFMFEGASKFNQDINDWDVSKATSFKWMFLNAYAFNQDLNDWEVSNSENFSGMFEGASSFNQPLNKWADKLTRVEFASSMFKGASKFNQDLSSWTFPAGVLNADFAKDTPAWVLPKPNFP